MLKIYVPPAEGWDENKQEFIEFKGQHLALEHSLVSVSKWEAKWHKPFLDSDYKKTTEQVIDYVKCMTLTQNVNPDTYTYLTAENFEQVNEYVNNSMTATWFNEKDEGNNKKKSREKITSELIYYWMITLNIPFECQKWHLNRLMTLIRVCEIKNANQYGNTNKKMSKSQLISRNASLNAARRKALHSKG